MRFNIQFRKNHYLIYGLALAVLLFLLKWLELKLMIINNSYELYIGLIAIIFMGLGIWLALKLSKPKTNTLIVEKEVYKEKKEDFSINEEALNNTGISKRELEVLELMSYGLSNNEIAKKLFLSVNTVKTHSKNLFEKLEAERRTQAIDIGKKIGLIP